MIHLETFFEYLRLNHYAKNSIICFRYTLKKVEKYFLGHGIKDERTITEAHITEMIKYFFKDGKEFQFRNILNLRKYFKYLTDFKIIFINPMTDIDVPKRSVNNIKPVSKDDLLESLDKIGTDDDFGIRSKAMFEFLYSTGIRPFEMLNMKLNDIDLEKKELFIKKGKKNKDRVVPVGSVVIFCLEKYIKDVRPKYLKNRSNDFIFNTFSGKRKNITTHYLSILFQETFTRYGIKRFKPYALRTSCATHLLVSGMNISYIQELLGHTAITTTYGYYDKQVIMFSYQNYQQFILYFMVL
jgi:integrase/recombinase XerD